jgi:DNA replication protein DnaC
VSRYTVAEYLRRATVVGITWPVPPGFDDAVLDRLVHTTHRIELKGESLRKLRVGKAARLDEATAS